MTMVQSNMLVLRAMTADDAAIVARLHAASWRTAYRGILSDEYLAGEVELERMYPVGFVFVLCDVDAVYGNLVDNLHVAPEARSAGIGPQLLAAAAAGIEERRWNRRVHLWVWDANMRARAFYKRMGGREVESTLKSAPDGTEAKSWRVVWDDVSALQLQQRNTA
jgi:GNAT superfamily N-acetyltransferase